LAIGLFKSDGREALLVWTLEVAQIDGRTGSVTHYSVGGPDPEERIIKLYYININGICLR